MAPEAFDADVVLGITAKATQVFAEGDDKFFSYPLAPIGFRQKDLQDMVSGATAEGIRTLSEFSYLVNAIPSGPLWAPQSSGFLWEAYGDVLVNAELAEATRSKAEEKAYEKAYRYLHEVHSDGLVTDSEAVLRYRQYRDAWLVVAEQYRNAAAEAEAATDPAVAKTWKEVTEPALREKQGEIERQWKTEGRRAEVEEAQRVEEQLSQRSPAESWSRYRKLFDPSTPEIFFATDVNGGRYVPTSFRPSNALDGAWGQCETTAEFDHAYEAGARRMVGSIDANVLDDRRLARVANGEVLVSIELYRNIQPNLMPDWRNANAGVGGHCIACYESDTEGAVYTPVSSYRELGYYAPKRDSVYAVGLTADDWQALG